MPRRRMTDQERATRSAERWNAKQAEAHPLFAQAGMLDQVAELRTPAFYTQARDNHAQAMIECDKRLEAGAEYFRCLLADLDPRILAEADTKWNSGIYPQSPEYRANFYRGAYKKAKGAPPLTA